MLNSLISRGPTGGDFLRGGWKYSEESLAFASRSKELIRFLLSSPWSPWSSCSLWKVNSIDKMNSMGILSRSLFTKRRNVFRLSPLPPSPPLLLSLSLDLRSRRKLSVWNNNEAFAWSIRRNYHEKARVRLSTDKFSFRPSITRRPSLFTGSLSFTVINGTRYRCVAKGTSPPIFAILQHPTISCETYEHVETRWSLVSGV